MKALEVFKLPTGRILAFGQESIDALLRHRQNKPKAPEAGGILLGRILLATGDVIVDEATPPSTADERSRFGFRRGRSGAQTRVRQAWADSEGTRIYLGEWHTHPEPHPTPSVHDIGEWCRISREARYEQSFLLFAILGTESLRVWRIERGTDRPMRLVST